MPVGMPKRRRIVLWIAGLVLLVGLNLLRDMTRATNRYDWEPVKVETLHQSVSNPGVMEAVQVSTIKSEVDEIMEKKYVTEGDKVKAGDPLLQLSRTRTNLEYEQRNNSYLNAQSDFKKAAREVGIQKKLLKNMAVSRQQVEDAEQNLERTRAALGIAEQEYQIVKKKLDGTLVRSPLNGVVLKIFNEMGQSVNVGKELITVGDISRFIVRTKVDELDIQQVHPGQAVEVEADAFPGKTMKGVVRSIASQAEREAFAKLEVIIDIDPATSLPLKHNLSVRVNILTSDIPNAIGVPIKAVLKKEGDRAWIYVRGKNGVVTKREVTLGKTAGNKVQVASGLSAGENVGTERSGDAKP